MMNMISIAGLNAINARYGEKPKKIIRATNHLYASNLVKNAMSEKR